MVNNKVVTTTRRYLNLARRVIEATVVLSLSFLTTVLVICFGWVALLFKSTPRASRIPANSLAFSRRTPKSVRF